MAERVPLENYANNFSPPPSNRQRRYARRGLLWDLSSLERLRKCGRVSVLPGGSVAVRLAHGVAGYAGLATCGSVWSDPVCNAKVMARRAVEVGAAVAIWQAQGGSVAFCTFTMRHNKGQGLPALWDALSGAWNRVVGGAPWIRNKQRYGIAGWLRVVEVTHGKNGWHVHIHALVFLQGKQWPSGGSDLGRNGGPVLDGSGSTGLLEQLHAAMFGRWSSALEKAGLSAPLMIGQDAHLVTSGADKSLAEYFTKATDRRPSEAIGLEVTQSQTKKSRDRHKTRTPWALLDDVEDLGLADSLGLWHEWERGSKGRKQMTWSMGFRAQLGLLVEQSDDEIVAVEHGSAEDDLVLIDANGWAQLTRRPVELADLLTVTQAGGLSALRGFLDSRGVTYVLPSAVAS